MGSEVVPEERVAAFPAVEPRPRAQPPPLPRAALERMRRSDATSAVPRLRAQPPPLPPAALERMRRNDAPAARPVPPRPRAKPPPIPLAALQRAPKAELTTPRPRGTPPPLPAAVLNRWGAGTVLPKAPGTLGWAIPSPPNHDLQRLERAQAEVEARAIKTGDAKSWYTTAAFEIRRAELTGNRGLLQSASLSLDFAERGANKLLSRWRGNRALHLKNIAELRGIVHERLSEERFATLKAPGM